MKNIIKIMLLNIKRNKIMLILAVSCSLLLCTLYEAGKPFADFFEGTSIFVGVIDYDKSPLSENLQEYLTESLDMKIEHGDYDELSNKLLNRDISIIIEIPEDFYTAAIEDDPDTLILTSLDDYENIAFIEAYLNSYMQSVSILANASSGNTAEFDNMLKSIEPEKIDVKSALVSDRDSKYSARGYAFAMGFFCMILGLLTIFISMTIIDDKLTQTYSRMRISNIKSIEYIIGTALFGIIVCAVASSGIYIYTGIKGVELGLPLSMAIFLNLLLILFSVGFSIMTALCFNTKNTVTTIAVGYTSIACIVGGAYFPIDDSVGIIKNLSYLTPHYWYTSIIEKYTEINLLNNIIILCLFVVLVYLISAVTFAKRNR